MLKLRKTIVVLSAGVLALCLSGCTDKAKEVQLVELQQLVSGPKGKNSTMWRGTFYCGTAGEFHYVRHTIELSSDLLLKIKTNELQIATIGKFPLERSKWVEISSVVLTNKPGQ